MQKQIEDHLEDFLSVRLLASEYSTDTLGIDENNCPVIIEYKRARDDNVLSQSLSYLNWLMNNRGRFELLVRDLFDDGTADAIEWGAPRVLCIAGEFGKHDRYALHEISRVKSPSYCRWPPSVASPQSAAWATGGGAAGRRRSSQNGSMSR
jgi:hypothetical protein